MIMKLLTSKQLPVFLALALCLAPCAFADISSDIEDYRSQKIALESEIKKLDLRIKSTDSLTKEEKKRLQVLQNRYQSDLARRRTELDSMNVNMQKQAAELQAERNRSARAQSTSDNIKAYRNALGKILAENCSDLEKLVSRSLPWEKEERVARVQALRRDLETGAASAEEGFSRLRSLYSEEIRFGDEVVLANKPIVRSDGETVNARILRIGNQWIVYQDDEGLRFGVLQRKEDGYEWREDLSFEEKQAVKLAIDVKLARKPPQMVSLPVSLSIVAGD